MTDYDVVVLIEQELSPTDAAQVRSLHEGLDEPVLYHVLIPMEDAAAQIEASMGSLSTGEMMPTPTLGLSEVDLEQVRKDCEDRSRAELATTVAAMEAAGATLGSAVLVAGSPIDALAEKVAAGRRSRGDHPHPTPRGGGVLPPRLDLQGPSQDRRSRAAPARARELRRAGRRRRGRLRALTRLGHRPDTRVSV